MANRVTCAQHFLKAWTNRVKNVAVVKLEYAFSQKISRNFMQYKNQGTNSQRFFNYLNVSIREIKIPNLSRENSWNEL